jgi:tetratricopeptide (TPR) repeat protein/tRNA A-37 threonylcarbamoyl transferase component Bud32
MSSTATAQEITEQAKGDINPNHITQTNSVSDPIIKYLEDGEQLHYFFFHHNKGFRIFEPSGSERTPDHDATSWGKRFLLVTDRRLLYIVGREDGDEEREFGYEEFTEVEANTGWTSGYVSFTTTDGTRFKFADSGGRVSDIEDAADYIRARMSEVGEANETDDQSDVDSDSGEQPETLSGNSDMATGTQKSDEERSGTDPAELDADELEARAAGDISGKELTATGGKVLKVGYFQTPIVERLRRGETVNHVLRNFVDGVKRNEEPFTPADNRRAVACLTDERIMFVVGVKKEDDHRVMSVPLEQIASFERDDGELVIKADTSQNGFDTYCFPVKNTGAFDEAMEYLSSQIDASVGDRYAEEIDEAIGAAMTAAENGQYDEALEQAYEAQQVYERYLSGVADLDQTDRTPRATKDEVDELVNEIRTRKLELELREREDTATEAQELAEKHYEDGAFDEAVNAYEDALTALRKAREPAERLTDADESDLVRRIEQLETRLDSVQIAALGQAVSDIDVPESGDPEVYDVADYREARTELEGVMERISEADIDREEDIELLREEVAGKLADGRIGELELRVRNGVQAYRDGEYLDAQETFEEIASGIEPTREDNLQEADAERLDEIETICEHNANVARKRFIGLDDVDEIRTFTPEEAKTETEADEQSRQSDTSRERERTKGTGGGRSESFVTPVEPTDPVETDIELTHDHFEEEELIGSGGNADVYLVDVDHDGVTEPVALKQPRIQGTMHQETIKKFASEAKTWSKLDDHPNIVSVVGHGSSPVPWIALEYMREGHLGNVWSRVDVGDRLEIAVQIVDAVWHAHQRGVAHLDLKPENVLFTETDGQLVPKVADWGLSKMLLDNSNSVEGLSPQYSAPEQFDTESYGSPDNQTDVYQLGIMLYELFGEKHPFDGSPAQIMNSVLTADLDPVSEYNDDIPAELDRIVGKATAKNKDERYETTVYLRDKLSDVLKQY